MIPIVGLVLCGGKSLRMGEDKGLMRSKDGLPWAQLIAEKLESFGVESHLSINQDQLASYEQITQSDKLSIDQDIPNIPGPLRGILTFHLSHPESDLFTWPCDVPYLNDAIVERLVSNFKDGGSVCAKTDFVQPICAIYSVKTLQEITIAWREGRLENSSMRRLIKDFGVSCVDFDNTRGFSNLNSPSDLL